MARNATVHSHKYINKLRSQKADSFPSSNLSWNGAFSRRNSLTTIPKSFILRFLYLISFLPSTQQIHVRNVCLTYNRVSITIFWHDQWKHWSHREAGRKAHSKAQERSQHWSTCRSENGNYTEVHSPQVVETVVPFLKQDICQSTRKSVHIYVWNFKSSCDFYKSVVGKHLLAPSV